MIPCINPKASYLSYKDEIDKAIKRVLESGWYILDKEVASFEKEFASFIGTKYAIGVASGTDAITLALKSLDIGIGDEVITTSFTATATISAIELTGAKAIFVNIEEDFFTIDTSKIQDTITEKTKAIVAVHIYGQPCNLDGILDIAKNNDLHVVEDCAQAHGAKYKGKMVGSMGDVSCFSFFPTKNLGAIGDGGAVLVNSSKLDEKLRMLRQYGWDEVRNSQFQGYNSRLDELQAAILRVKLKYLKDDIEKRNHIAKMYYENLKDTDFILPKVRNECYHAYHLFVIRSDNRDELVRFLKECGIVAIVHYDKAVHQENAYKENDTFPISEKCVKHIVSLPMYPELKDNDVKYIISSLKSFKG